MKRNWFLLILLCCYQLIGQRPNLVWVDANGGGRNEYVYFQKSIRITDSITAAKLYLYADSRYAFYVNGAYVNFGPSRSFHANPYYDTYDLKPLLQKGQNCLVVKALSNGMETFQLFDYRGAFAAWGEVETATGNIDLVSTEWRCKKSLGYDATMPRFSFATGAIENWDASKDIGWNQCEDTDTGWGSPIALKDQQWGTFRPRPIPMLTQEEVLAKRTGGPTRLSNKEQLYSLRIATTDENLNEYNRSQDALGYTYLFSEEPQEVVMGLWWGAHYLNGAQLKPDTLAPKTKFRRNYRLKLNKGWNLFVTQYGIIWGSWEFYMAIPQDVGILVSPDRSNTGTSWFKTMLPTTEKDQKVYNALDLSKVEVDLEGQFEGSFREHFLKDDANHPVRDMVWKVPVTGEIIHSEPFDKTGLAFEIPETGVALRYELEEIQLGRFFVEGNFPKGTIIDIGFSEEPHPDGGPWLYKRYQVAAGLRFVADGNTSRYESFKPYGAKFLQLNLYHPGEQVRIGRVGMVRQVYPFQTIGSFQSSDTVLNRIYEAGWRTLQLCAEDSYTDTPFRERGLYAGDMLPEMAVTMAMSGDMRLGKYSLALFQDMYEAEMYQGKQNRHNDFPLITLLTADYIRRYDPDPQMVSRLYENYASLLRHHLQRKDDLGLVHAGRVFIEWTDLNKLNASMTAYQALLYKGLLTLAEWAKEIGKTEEAAFFSKEAALLRKAINSHLWDAEKGMYLDGIKMGNAIEEHHLTSSIWPALYGVADEAQVAAILTNLKTELTEIGNRSRKRKITPYSSFYLFSLLYRHGETELADTFLKRHWSPMALHSERPTTWENFDIDGEQGTSSHAWSGHPTYFLATTALGVNLGWYQEMNPEVIEITPQSSHLEWAKGTVVHPSGPVQVAWQVKDNELLLNYRAPAGHKVIVAPKGRLAKLSLKIDPIPGNTN